MARTVVITSVRDVRIGPSRTSVVTGRDTAGIETEIVFNSADARNLAGPLLCCAAIEAGAFDVSWPPGSIVPGCDLLVLDWQVVRSAINGDPMLVVTLPGNAVLRFRFLPADAERCAGDLAAGGLGLYAPPTDSPEN
jgi:hypothetical protein